METALPLIAGLALLMLGGELFVRGAVQIAERMGVSPLLSASPWWVSAPRRPSW